MWMTPYFVPIVFEAFVRYYFDMVAFLLHILKTLKAGQHCTYLDFFCNRVDIPMLAN